MIRALIVDDSAFVRKIVREMLSRSPVIEVVGVARDGLEALALVEELKPDVVTCDLVMPRLDGVGFVREQMLRRPIPILILTATPQDAGMALDALAAGAVDLVQKPTALATEELLIIRDRLVERIQAVARVGARISPGKAEFAAAITAAVAHPLRRVDVVVLGISTGGPQALRHLLPQLPADFPVPIAMVLHMPVGYTAPFAEKLNEVSLIEVVEAAEGHVMLPGKAYLAAAGRHLTLRRKNPSTVVAQLSIHPLDRNHRPSVDILFQSAAEVYGSRVLGVVMTGMGDDGRQGAAWIKAQGGRILTEDEKSCIIYGMPRSVVEAGLSDRAVPLADMAHSIIENI